MRSFAGDKQFEALKKTVTDAYVNLFPVTNKAGDRLEIKKVWVDDESLDPDDFASQKKARLAGGTWGAPVYAAMELRDPEGKVVDRVDKVRLSTIPRLTPRGSYIVSGNEYQVNNQLRRRPGVYVLKSGRGDQFKTVFNVRGEGAKNFEVHFDPQTNKYSVEKIAGGQGKVGLHPLLHALGVSDKEMMAAWGAEVFSANAKDPTTELLKLAKNFANVDTKDPVTAKDAIRNQFQKTVLDPHVAKITLGAEHASVSPKVALDASKKLLGAYRGTNEADDPESLLFKEVLSVDNMLHDKLTSKKQVDAMKYVLGRHLGKRKSIGGVRGLINFQKLSSPVETFFKMDDRSSTPEQHNPIQMFSGLHKVVLTGTGGIKDPHTITPEVREVHPSQIGFIDPVHTPESQKIGTTLHLTAAAIKDDKSVKSPEVRTPVLNTKSGKLEALTPIDLYHKVVAFPDEADIVGNRARFHNKQVRAQRMGKVGLFTPSQVEYIFPAAQGLFSYSSNMVPFLQNDQGNRAMMAAKMIEQALPLVHREQPHVQTDIGTGVTFQKALGEKFSATSPVDGIVAEIGKDFIRIGKEKVHLYNDFPLNQKTFIHHEPLVKVGDRVKKGQLVADTNFTKNGTMAYGKNLNVAYLPYPGLTFEDGIVITESAAKKLAVQQMYSHSFDLEGADRITSLNKFRAYYPNHLSKENAQILDDGGVVKKGAIVKPGQIVIAGLKYSLARPENISIRKLNKSLQIPYDNAEVRYSGEFEGVVTDVVKRGDKIDVYVKAVEPAKESDKLAGVHGNKGVITKVIPDSEAPRTKNGVIPDVFLNPHGIIGRINLGQLYESAAGKIAAKTGKPYVIKNFTKADVAKQIHDDLKKHGLTDTEEMILPDGRSLGAVSMGSPYIMRLAKTGKTGFSARMPGTGYDVNMQPLRGGEEGTKALDTLTFYSMLSHGAKKNLVDAHQKSERNDEYWHAIETGKTVPAPKPSFAFNKFVSLLKGAGINPVKEGPEYVLTPMTDKETLKISRGEITDPFFLLGKNLEEKKGGFFDKNITGGKLGQHFSHVTLHETLPNPVFERAIRTIVGITGPQYADVIAGKKFVAKDGKLVDKNESGAIGGGPGIARLLDSINVESDIEQTRKKIRGAIGDEKKLDPLNRKLRYLTALRDLNLSPKEAYLRKHVPVVPPIHRPIIETTDRGLQVAPVNYLYQNVSILNESTKYPVMKMLGEEEKAQLKSDTYKATKQLAGLEPLEVRGKDQPIEGFVSQITGSSPKQGFFLNKLITKRQDLVGRGVITAAPDLHVDQIGIPEKMAWKIFRPFVMREFTSAGIKPDVARKEIDDQTARAKQVLEVTMKKRTVLMNRAPSLHKFSIMAFKPTLSDSLAIRVPPLVLKGFGGDFDGDAVTIHVPVSEEALRESHKMLPSANLYKPGTGELMIMPSQESAIGLYFLSQNAAGRSKINAMLPAKYHIDSALDARAAKDFFNRLAKEEPTAYGKIVTQLRDVGDLHAYERGFTVSLKDLKVDTKNRDRLFARADTEAERLRRTTKAGAEQDRKISAVYTKAAEESFKDMKPHLKAANNNLYHMVTSGARGKDSQLMQILSAPGIMKDSKDRSIPTPVRRSYAEGLSTADYFVSAYGVRKGMMDRALQTAKPGEVNKDIMAMTLDNIITANDCGTHKGVRLPLSSPDVYDRLLASNQFVFKRNDKVTPQMISAMNKKGLHDIMVRSPLTCIAPKGTCAHCFGIDEHGKVPEIGDNIGAKMGQTMSEPMTQFVMRTFHTGGIASGMSAQGFERVSQLLKMPQYVAGEAAIGTQSGRVSAIKKSPAGGHIVTIGKTDHVVRPGQPLKVKIGDSVAAGDVLSEGVIKPQNLVKYKGMEAAQNYVVDELKKTYDQQLGGSPMQRKVFETVVRSIGNLTKVVNAPKHSDFVPGDVVPYTTAVHYNETRSEHMPTDDAVGYKLKNTAGKLPAFHEISHNDVPYLKGLGYNSVDALKDPLVHAPILKGIERMPMEKKNWMAQLGYRYIKEALTEAAAQKWKSNVESTHPVPAFAYGASFGRKKETY